MENLHFIACDYMFNVNPCFALGQWQLSLAPENIRKPLAWQQKN